MTVNESLKAKLRDTRLFTLASALLLTCSLSSCKTAETTGTDGSKPDKSATTGNAGPIVKCANTALPATKEILDGEREVLASPYPAGQFGGMLRRSIVMADPKTFNYWAAADSTSRELASLLFSPLFDSDPNTGDLVPALAKSWKMDEDKMTYTVVLRKGVKWSDGKPFTADDVVYTWNKIIKEGYGNSSLRDVSSIEGKSPEVTKIDDYTVQFKTAIPFVPFFRVMGFPVAPKHIVEPVISGKDGRKAFDSLFGVNSKEKFVTNGPYVLESYVPGQRVVFKRAENYYMLDENKKSLPYIETQVFSIVQDVQSNLLKFKGGEIDITPVRCRDAGDLVKEAEKLNFKLYDFGANYGSTFITFNLNQRKDPKSGKLYVDPIKSAWFNDVNFRQAINHAIDRKNVVNNYFKGLGAPAFTAATAGAPFTNDELKPFERNVEEAKAMLAKSGFTWKDGKCFDKAGHAVEFDLLSSAGGTFYGFVGVAFKKDMEALGIKVNYQEIDGNLLQNRVLNSLDWQAVLFSLTGDPLEPNDSVNVYKSSGRLHLFDQRQQDKDGTIKVSDARPWEKEIDDLLDKGAKTFDKAERKKIYDRVQAVFYEQVPFIYIASPKQIVGVRNTLRNYDPTPLTQLGLGLHNLPELWISK